MLSRRRWLATLIAMVLSALIVTQAAAANPLPSPPPSPGPVLPSVPEAPLTPEQQAASDSKVAAAHAYLAVARANGGDLATLQCVVPTGTDSASEPLVAAGTGVSGRATIQACGVPQGFLAVEGRDQIFGHYCGPAVGQVIANYSWAVGPGRNAFTQQQLAGWMGTDANGATSSQALANGLEVATRGAPRRPAMWTWIVTALRDDDGDGHVGDELHGFIRANVSGSRMPLAFSLKPHDRFAQFRLTSWPFPVNSPGHWIAGYGWLGTYNNNDFARTYYTDSSRDEGGSTGRFWDPTRHIAEMIKVHTGVFVW
jgi:hypothetical protein